MSLRKREGESRPCARLRKKVGAGERGQRKGEYVGGKEGEFESEKG